MTTEKKIAFPKPKTVAEYIEYQVNMNDKSQGEIAKEAGFRNANMISMLKNGLTKLPLEKVGKFARAIGVDPIHLLKMCMQEYQPDTWNEIKSMFAQPILTAHELKIIELIREANPNDPDVETDKDRALLQQLFAAIKTD